MNEDLIEKWNATVTNEDEVYYLGDFSMSPQYAQKILPRLNRKEIHLIHGNHDRTFKNPSYIEKYKAWGFDSVKTERFDTFGTSYIIRLNHLPYPGNDHTYVDRYSEKRPIHKNEDFLFHGHCHSKPENRVRNKQMIDVGVDAWEYKPVSLEEILSLL